MNSQLLKKEIFKFHMYLKRKLDRLVEGDTHQRGW